MLTKLISKLFMTSKFESTEILLNFGGGAAYWCSHSRLEYARYAESVSKVWEVDESDILRLARPKERGDVDDYHNSNSISQKSFR